MNRFNRAPEAAAAALFALALVSAAAGQDRPGVAYVGDRQAAMREMQVPRGYFLAELGNDNPDMATIKAEAAIVREKLQLAEASFPANTKAGGDVEGAHVRARDSLWDDWDQVQVLFEQGVKAVDDLSAAADANDKDAALAAAQALSRGLQRLSRRLPRLTLAALIQITDAATIE